MSSKKEFLERVLGVYIVDKKLFWEMSIARIIISIFFVLAFVLTEVVLGVIILKVESYAIFRIFLGFSVMIFSVRREGAVLFNFALYIFLLIISIIFIIKEKGLLYELSSHNYSGEILSVTEAFFLAFFLSIALAFIFPAVPNVQQTKSIEIVLYEAILIAPFSEELSFRLLPLLVPIIIKELIIFREEISHNMHWVMRFLVNGKENIDYVDWILIFCSGIYFGIAHYAFGWPFNKIYQASLLGIFLGYMAVKRGLISSIMFHIVWNAYSTSILLPMLFNLDFRTYILVSRLIAIWILIGIFAGFFVLIISIIRLLTGRSI